MYVVEEKKPDHGRVPKVGASRSQSTGSTRSDNFSIQIVTPNVAMTSTFCRVAACLPDLEMWRQGFPVSPQWEGDLELGSDEENDDRNAPGDSDDESGPKKDFVSEVSETSLQASIRDFLSPPDVLIMRTAGWEICRIVVLSHEERWQ